MLCFLPISIIGARSAQSGIKTARTPGAIEADRARRWPGQASRFAPAQRAGWQALAEADDVDLAASCDRLTLTAPHQILCFARCATDNKILSPQQVDSFVELGYCTLWQAFTARQAAAACRCVWRRMDEKAGIRETDPRTWPESYDIEEHLNDPDVLACFTDRLVAAVQELLGPGRWCGRRKWGLWPVNFRFGADRPYDIVTTSWHIDGNWFRHSIDCPFQGLLIIGLFTDTAPRGGGTILAGGSHKQTARVLARHPDGIAHLDLFAEVLAEPLGNFHEVTGAAGDVVLAHPFLFHSRGMKHVGPPRIISNTEASLRQPMQLARPDPADHSILEQSIIAALQLPPIPPQGARMCCY